MTASDAPADAATSVVRAALDAVAAMDWPAVVALIHPDALERFWRSLLASQRSRVEHEAAATERTDVAPEVAAWMREQQELSATGITRR